MQLGSLHLDLVRGWQLPNHQLPLVQLLLSGAGPMLLAETEHLSEVVQMRGQISTEDEDVIHVHKTER